MLKERERSEVEDDAVNGSYGGEVQRNEVEENRSAFLLRFNDEMRISCSWRLWTSFPTLSSSHFNMF